MNKFQTPTGKGFVETVNDKGSWEIEVAFRQNSGERRKEYIRLSLPDNPGVALNLAERMHNLAANLLKQGKNFEEIEAAVTEEETRANGEQAA